MKENVFFVPASAKKKINIGDLEMLPVAKLWNTPYTIVCTVTITITDKVRHRHEANKTKVKSVQLE